MPTAKALRVRLVTTWETACGIAEHAAMLKAAVEGVDPAITIVPDAEALDPTTLLLPAWRGTDPSVPSIVHLNYQAALHARWDAAAIRSLRAAGSRVIVTYHDTGVPNSDQCKAICDAADAVVVHEPCDDLPAAKVRYWRMGVPAAPMSGPSLLYDRPYLGTVGFPFPWKCYDALARVTAANGWGLLLLAPTATPEQIAVWQTINPATIVCAAFLPQAEVIARLNACDATAFTYVCHNTGQSGAILQGIAARKPVIALRTCRQMRALAMDALGEEAICWAETFEDVGAYLRHLPLGRMDAGIVALAHQERWDGPGGLGERYAQLYREVCGA